MFSLPASVTKLNEVDLLKFHNMSPGERKKAIKLGTGTRTCESCFRCEHCGMAFWDHEQCAYHENYIHGMGRSRKSELKDAIQAAKLAGKRVSAAHLDAIYKHMFNGKSKSKI